MDLCYRDFSWPVVVLIAGFVFRSVLFPFDSNEPLQENSKRHLQITSDFLQTDSSKTLTVRTLRKNKITNNYFDTIYLSYDRFSNRCSKNNVIFQETKRDRFFLPTKIDLKKEVSVSSALRTIRQQTGYLIEFNPMLEDQYLNKLIPYRGAIDFWEMMIDIGEVCKRDLDWKAQGAKIVFNAEKRFTRIRSITGSFILQAKEIRCQKSLEDGQVLYELICELFWEPKYEMFRVDELKLLGGKDNNQTELVSEYHKTPSMVRGYQHTLKIPLKGLTRKSKQIDRLELELMVTGCQELLLFRETDINKPEKKEQKQVGFELTEIKSDSSFTSFSIHLSYPKENASFESFETYWLDKNRLILIDPSGTKIPIDSFESNGDQLTYHLKTARLNKIKKDWQGWKLEYRTPSIIRDIPLRFELKNIQLP